MARGGKRGHKGRGKSYTNPEALERQRVKDEKEREWRKARGEVVTDTSEDEDSSGSGSDSSGSGNDASGSEDGIAFSKEEGGAKGGPTDRAAAKAKKAAEKAERAAKQLPPRDMPPSSSSDSDSEDESRKPKGAEGMIQVENPNLVVKKNKKVSQLEKEVGGSKEASSSSSKKEKAPEKPQLSRREAEADPLVVHWDGAVTPDYTPAHKAAAAAHFAAKGWPVVGLYGGYHLIGKREAEPYYGLGYGYGGYGLGYGGYGYLG